MESKKAVCENRRCGWHGTMDDVLRGPDPFDPEEIVIGCPRCRGVECLLTADAAGLLEASDVRDTDGQRVSAYLWGA